MGKEAEIAAKFWKALRSDRTIMLGLAGVEEGHAQPMTALLDGDEDAGPIWIFSAKNVDLVKALGQGNRRRRISLPRIMACSRPSMAC